MLDATGTPLTGRTITFAFGGQNLTAVTDGTGVARTTVAPASAPEPVPLTASFAGDGTNGPATVSRTITIDREDTVIRYTGKTLLGTAVPQPVSASLVDADSQAPIANRTVTFEVGTVRVTVLTNASRVASASLVLGESETSGPASMKVSFAGDPYYKPAFQGTAVTIYLSTSFVVWGGNTGGLKLGLNPYLYAEADPVNRQDPLGQQAAVERAVNYIPILTLLTAATGACYASRTNVLQDVGNDIKCTFHRTACLLTVAG